MRLIGRLAALGDLARLRLLRLLEKEELSVGELAQVLQLPQSTVSRHLKLLLDDDWLGKRAAGTASLYRLDPAELDDAARRLWEVARDQLEPSPTLSEDDERLESVLRERKTDSRTFFGAVGGEWDDLRRRLFGDAFTTAALVGLAREDWTVADLGCGTGNASEVIAPYVSKVIAIDREPAMLDAARRRLAELGNVDFRQGDLEHLPLDDGEVDAALVFLVLHHVERPGDAVREIARTLGPGGLALILDMVSHDREAFRRTMGHRHLGFCEDEVSAWAEGAGLGEVRYRRLPPDVSGSGPGLFVATMRKTTPKRE